MKYRKKLINGKKVEEDLLMYYGFVMLEIGKPQKCIKCLNNLLKETYKLERTRYYKYMGLAHYILGDYKHIQSMFNCVLPKKIDIYVFNTECDNLGNTLSYANPALCTIHTKLEHAEIVFGVSFKSKLKSFEQMINKSLKGRLRNER